MRYYRPSLNCVIAAVGLLVCGVGLAAPITFMSLLEEMTDLERLTHFPDPAYTVKQFSSYDRRSTDPAVQSDENWYANGDRGQHLRTEERNGEKEWVMMDAPGPGAIVRIWSANPADAGIVRIYLDGAEKPEIEMPLAELLGGGNELFPAPIAGERSRGWNCYLPIPYATQCRVTASKPDFYYHINYRTYAEGTPVKPFAVALARKHRARIAEAAEKLAAPAEARMPDTTVQNGYASELGPGASGELLLEDGAAAIYSITAKVVAEDLEAALRGTLLQVFYDGNDGVPDVEAPLGDFFGTAPGLNVYQSLPLGVLEDGTLYAHWVMPYQKSARLLLTNHSGATVRVSGDVTTAAYTWTEQSLYFHAKWRAERDIPTQPRQDWTFLAANGKGRYVGNMLHVSNAVPDWWGEGDEKIYVDNEPFPSHFGTGTEDYYGYAWCSPEPFVHAYHNQPRCDGPANFGQTCVSRFHIIDDIPFTTAFKFDIEVWHWKETLISQSATSYWYAAPGSIDGFKRVDAASLSIPVLPEHPSTKKVEGGIEGETLRTIAHSGGAVSTQTSYTWGWSGAKQVWWINAKPGDTFELGFPVKKAGRYDVRAVFTKAVDYGIAQVYVNGEAAGTPIDFFNPEVIAAPEQSLGVFALQEGENVLKVEITGANPDAVPSHMFGLDYLLLKPAS